mgnify:CR=1 FL=1
MQTSPHSVKSICRRDGPWPTKRLTMVEDNQFRNGNSFPKKTTISAWVSQQVKSMRTFTEKAISGTHHFAAFWHQFGLRPRKRQDSTEHSTFFCSCSHAHESKKVKQTRSFPHAATIWSSPDVVGDIGIVHLDRRCHFGADMSVRMMSPQF